MSVTKPPLVPSFYLYGEAPRDVGDRFLHLEDLDDRSRPSEWKIRPHAHENLHHVLFILTGDGEMRTEQGPCPFVAPALLLVPAATIHAFSWRPETTGRVLTISDGYAAELFTRAPDFSELFKLPLHIAVPPRAEEKNRLTGSLIRLARELAWQAPGHDAAVEAHLVAFLVEVLRISLHDREQARTAPGRHAEIVARFRQLVEVDFRKAQKLETYAEKLHMTISQLRTACLKITRKSPSSLVLDRQILEAKRLLLYSNMTIAEIAYALGFEDPAYFSRFFKKATHEPPRNFRQPRSRQRQPSG
jgi:AraC family transcriptional activator of pobA